MKKYTSSLVMLLIALIHLSCKDDEIGKLDEAKSLIIGQWNSYEMGSQETGFVPGRETLIINIYASGMAFFEDGKFRMRFYDDLGWHEGPDIGVYEFKNETTVELIFYPNTVDEFKLELQIIKLGKDHLWFQHRRWVNDQNPNPTEHHLNRAG